MKATLLDRITTAAERGSVRDIQTLLDVFDDDDSSVQSSSSSSSSMEESCSSLSSVFGPYALLETVPLVTTACIVACIYGHTHVVDYILQHHRPLLEINQRDDDGDTALDCAAAGGYTEIVRLLLQHAELAINAVDSCGWAPLHYAADQGNVALVRLLLADSRTNVNVTTSVEGQTALHLASQRGHREVVQVLLQQPGVEWNRRTNDDETAWQVARDEMTRSLIALVCSRLPTPPKATRQLSYPKLIFCHGAARLAREPTMVLVPSLTASQ